MKEIPQSLSCNYLAFNYLAPVFIIAALAQLVEQLFRK
jgi:hypothetical protein